MVDFPDLNANEIELLIDFIRTMIPRADIYEDSELDLLELIADKLSLALSEDSEDWIIDTQPPFARPRSPDYVFGLNRAPTLGITNRVLRINQKFPEDVKDFQMPIVSRERVFFFDIDEKPEINEVIRFIDSLNTPYAFLLAETEKGYHVFSPNIFESQIALYPLFMKFREQFKSDYEWFDKRGNILRLGAKNGLRPEYRAWITPRKALKVSLGHLKVFAFYWKIPVAVLKILLKLSHPSLTYTELVEIYVKTKDTWIQR